MFKQAAGDAQNLYNSKSGYNIYTGPTQANYSSQRLQGLNKAMQMTGGGDQITNDSIFNSPQIQQMRAMIKQQQDARAAQAAAAAQAQQAPKQQQQNRRIWVDNINGNSWGPRGGYWTDAPPDYYGNSGGRGR